MRTYPRNSPEAAARILALGLLADGHVGQAEMARLMQLDAGGRLGMDADGFQEVIAALCADLPATDVVGGLAAQQLDTATLDRVLAEVTDPGLQLIVLQLCAAAIDADAHIADGERAVLKRLADHWHMPVPVLRAPNAYRAAVAA